MNFKFVQGSVFDFEELDLDAVLIFVPCGLTFLRYDAEKFIEKDFELLKDFQIFQLYKLKSGERKFIFIHRNESHKLIEENHATEMLIKMIYLLARNGIKKIGMNGIRLRNEGVIPEKWLFDEVKKILEISEFPFDQITFIDKRGGFNKIENLL